MSYGTVHGTITVYEFDTVRIACTTGILAHTF